MNIYFSKHHFIPVYVLAAPVEVQWDFLAALQHAVGQELGQYAVLAMDDEKVDKDPNGPIRGEMAKNKPFKSSIRDETKCAEQLAVNYSIALR